METTTSLTADRILEAATELFYEFGYHGTTTRAVAARVGIQAGSIYNHFPSKEEMLYRIALGSMQDALRGAREAIEGLSDPEERLRALVEWHVRFNAVERFRNKVTDGEVNALAPARRAEIVAMRDELEEIHREILADGARTAGWNVGDVAMTTFAIVTMCTAIGTWFREEGRLGADEIARHYADIAVAAAKGQRPGRTS